MGHKHKKSFTKRNRSSESHDALKPQPASQKGSFLNKLANIPTMWAFILISALGLIVFFSGLANSFVGDDYNQIVGNVPVHSISNIGLFFRGGTFYNNEGLAPLRGVYYRPLMTTVFSILYSAFGANPLPFHLLQLGLHILNTFLLFLIFRYFFKPVLSLALALVFLVHPINSQAVYAIATMQDQLCLIFGLLAIWTVVRFQYRENWLLVPTIAFLFLSLLAKEAGIVFVCTTLAYVFIADRKRFLPLLGMTAIMFVVYLPLKIHAVGLAVNPNIAPIDALSLGGRLFNAPAIILFFLSKLLFPLQLAHAYYWVHAGITLTYPLIPLVLELAVTGLGIYAGLWLHKNRPQRDLMLYLFFSIWLAVGVIISLQIAPLDMTVSESWFYLPMAGLLGMIGILLEAYQPRLTLKRGLALTAVLIIVLSVRTEMRGFDWADQSTISSRDLAVSKEDYVSEATVAHDLASQGSLEEAKEHAEHSVATYPTFSNENTLGTILTRLGDYPAARQAYTNGIKYGDSFELYMNLATLTLANGDSTTNRQFLSTALNKFPNEPSFWLYIAVLDSKDGNFDNANKEIAQAYKLNQTDARINWAYQKINSGLPANLPLNLSPQ